MTTSECEEFVNMINTIKRDSTQKTENTTTFAEAMSSVSEHASTLVEPGWYHAVIDSDDDSGSDTGSIVDETTKPNAFAEDTPVVCLPPSTPTNLDYYRRHVEPILIDMHSPVDGIDFTKPHSMFFARLLFMCYYLLERAIPKPIDANTSLADRFIDTMVAAYYYEYHVFWSSGLHVMYMFAIYMFTYFDYNYYALLLIVLYNIYVIVYVFIARRMFRTLIQLAWGVDSTKLKVEFDTTCTMIRSFVNAVDDDTK